jgi:tetratricopeptide (TPR) repeat protein
MASSPPPTLDEANALLRAAEAALAGGDYLAARDATARVLLVAPDHPQILQLHAVALRGTGALGPALAAVERAIATGAVDARLHDTRGNILGDLGRHAEALAAHEAALALEPHFAEAAAHRAATLQALGRLGEARQAYAAIADAAGTEALAAYAALEFELGDPDVAAAVAETALARTPGHAPARRLRLRIASERAEPDATMALRVVSETAPEDRGLLVDRLRAVGDAAGVAQAEALLATDPSWGEGRDALATWARERHGRADWLARHEAAVAANPRDAAAWRALATLQSKAGDFAAAADTTLRAEAATGDPAFAAAAFAFHAASGAGAAADALLIRPEVAALVEPKALAKPRLAQRDPAAAEALLAPLCAATDDLEAWALRGVGWQLAGDARWEWLNGQAGQVASLYLGLSAAEVSETADHLAQLHDDAIFRLGQSVRGGTQTFGNLFHRLDPSVRRLRAAVLATVERYRAGLPPADPSHPTLRHRDAPWRLSASWSVRLSSGGFHVSHIHPKGIFSSASYWRLPAPDPTSADPHAGWLELGRPPAYLGLDLPAIATLEPAPGRLILFPSTLHHGTRPFSAGERITAAFDLAPVT